MGFMFVSFETCYVMMRPNGGAVSWLQGVWILVTTLALGVDSNDVSQLQPCTFPHTTLYSRNHVLD